MILALPAARFLAAEGCPPSGGKDVEVIINRFEFDPEP